jgi:hypothetical protein
MATCWTTPTIDHNVIINLDGFSSTDINNNWLTLHPSNTVLSDPSTIGFTSPTTYFDATGNYRLTGGSAYHNAASDGTDIGVNYTTLIQHLGFDPNP